MLQGCFELVHVRTVLPDTSDENVTDFTSNTESTRSQTNILD